MSLFKSNKSEFKDTLKVIHINSCILLLTLFWDFNDIGVTNTYQHIAFKLLFILLTYPPVFLIKTKRFKEFSSPLILITLFLYSYYFTVYFHYTYYTSFFQYFLAGSLVLRFTRRAFFPTYIIGFGLLIWASNSLGVIPHEARDFAKEIMVPAFTTWIFSIFWFTTIIENRNKTRETNQLFAELGKASNFLLHELSSPINRLSHSMPNNSHSQDEVKRITNLLNLTRAMTQDNLLLEKQDIDLTHIVKKHLRYFDRTIDVMDIETNVDLEEIKIFSHEDFIETIIKNLITNAIEHLSNYDGSRTLRVKLFKNHRGVQLRVANSSLSYSKSELSKMYEAHYSSKKSGGSNQGLGLYLCTKMVNALELKLVSSYKNGEINFDLEI